MEGYACRTRLHLTSLIGTLVQTTEMGQSFRPHMQDLRTGQTSHRPAKTVMCSPSSQPQAKSLAHRTFLMRCLHAAVRPDAQTKTFRISFRALSCGELTHKRDLPLPYGRVPDTLEGLPVLTIGRIHRDVPLACRGLVLAHGCSPECGRGATNKQ